MSKKQIYFIRMIFISILFIIIYLNVRFVFFILADFHWTEKIFGFFLLWAELFISIQTIGYLIHIFNVISNPVPAIEPVFSLKEYPPVAVVLASYKEPLEIIRNTLICFYNLTYPNKYLYLLDDTRYELPWDTEENKQKYRSEVEKLCEEIGVNLFRSKWHHAKAGKLNDFLQYIDGNVREDFQMFNYQNKSKPEKEKYLLVFDADMDPIPNAVEELVLRMEENPKAAFIQTPQYYINFLNNRVACAAGLQQAIFYEYICEGKGVKGLMFCCGTNVMMRCEALKDVGGYDEESVTEDIATSLKMHLKGWKSIYLNNVLAFGLGPEDLSGYFKQQFRWARGTIGLLKRLLTEMFKNFNFSQKLLWWEYLLSSTHYFVGFAFLILILSPIMFLFFNTPSYFTNFYVYIVTYIPYQICGGLLFFLSLTDRKYKALDLGSALLINAVAFPTYISATICAIFGLGNTFGVTPKVKGKSLPLYAFIPQIFLALLCICAAAWGIMRYIYEYENRVAFIVNVIWCLLNFSFISFFLYLNHSEEESKI